MAALGVPRPSEQPVAPTECGVCKMPLFSDIAEWDGHGFWFVDCIKKDSHIGWQSPGGKWTWCNYKCRKADPKRPWPAHAKTPKRGESSVPVPPAWPGPALPAAAPEDAAAAPEPPVSLEPTSPALEPASAVVAKSNTTLLQSCTL